MENNIEEIAKLEHEQWISWSKTIAQTENISDERLKRWKKLWIPYSELCEEEKEQDRVWARKKVLIEHCSEQKCPACSTAAYEKGKEDERKRISGMIEKYSHVCGACCEGVSNLSHTLICQMKSHLKQSLLKDK